MTGRFPKRHFALRDTWWHTLRSCLSSERSLELKAGDLVGTWCLRSWKNVSSDRSAADPSGVKPVGYIFYNHDGYMSVQIMAALQAGGDRASYLLLPVLP
jgi:hypothetical protein